MSATSLTPPQRGERDAAYLSTEQPVSAFGSSKILHRHLERLAVVYVRQSVGSRLVVGYSGARLRELAEKLGMPTRTLRSWLDRGWLHGKQLGAHGRWLVWADDDELNRLTQLRQHRGKSTGLPAPAELTTPKARPEN